MKVAYRMDDVLDKMILFPYQESGNCIEVLSDSFKWVFLRCESDRFLLTPLGVHPIDKDFSQLQPYYGEWHESQFG